MSSRRATVDASALLAAQMNEKQLQEAVVDLARVLGWLVYHPFDSRRSECGYPDLTLVWPGRNGQPGRLIFAEIKSERGKVRPEQRVWLAALGACPGVEVFVWRPAQWRSGEVERVLRAGEMPATVAG